MGILNEADWPLIYTAKDKHGEIDPICHVCLASEPRVTECLYDEDANLKGFFDHNLAGDRAETWRDVESIPIASTCSHCETGNYEYHVENDPELSILTAAHQIRTRGGFNGDLAVEVVRIADIIKRGKAC